MTKRRPNDEPVDSRRAELWNDFLGPPTNYELQMQKPRADLYGPIHQGIRRLLYQTALDLGTTDFRSAEETNIALDELELALSLLSEHAETEDEYFHPELAERTAGAVKEHEEMHELLEEQQATLEALAAEVRTADSTARVPLASELYSKFNEYVATQIQHMAAEESELRPLFWQHFTDEELEGIRGKIMAKLTPGRRAEWFKWMLPSLSQVQLVGMLGGMRQSMPPAAFDGLCSGISGILGERWSAIATEIGL